MIFNKKIYGRYKQEIILKMIVHLDPYSRLIFYNAKFTPKFFTCFQKLEMLCFGAKLIVYSSSVETIGQNIKLERYEQEKSRGRMGALGGEAPQKKSCHCHFRSVFDNFSS